MHTLPKRNVVKASFSSSSLASPSLKFVDFSPFFCLTSDHFELSLVTWVSFVPRLFSFFSLDRSGFSFFSLDRSGFSFFLSSYERIL